MGVMFQVIPEITGEVIHGRCSLSSRIAVESNRFPINAMV